MNEHQSRIVPIVTAVKNGTKTARAFAEEALAKIAAAEKYNAVLQPITERSLQRADQIDRAVAAGEITGRLAGVPFIAKDNLLTFGSKTTAASQMLADLEAPYQATVIERLEAEGAIVVGKANLDAFAHGSSTENSDFGPTKNPRNPEFVPGGSSGGSAAVIALDIVPFALGSDTGGSIRLPASYCGVVGLKPTYGAVSRYGAVAMASSTDVIGPLTHNAYDARLILEIMGGQDERDATSHTIDAPQNAPLDIASLKIGVIKQHMAEGVDPEVRALVEGQIEKLRRLGASVTEVDLPTLDAALPAYYVIVPAELSSNLARYDGIRYGHTATAAATNLDDYYSKTRAEGFNDENIRRIMIGTFVLSSGYYDAYYRKAQTVRTVIINEFNKAFEQVDIMIGPTAPSTAFKLGQNTHDPLSMYLADVMTVGISLAGLPAVSVPAGDANGLPVGLQITGRLGADYQILALAAEIGEDK